MACMFHSYLCWAEELSSDNVGYGCQHVREGMEEGKGERYTTTYDTYYITCVCVCVCVCATIMLIYQKEVTASAKNKLRFRFPSQ